MPSDDAVVIWCSDALHDVLGFTDSALASYLVAVARRKNSSPSSILTELKNGGISDVSLDRLNTFCQALHAKCAPPSTSSGTAQKKATQKSRTNADWVKQAAKYKLLDDEEEESTITRDVVGSDESDAEEEEELGRMDGEDGKGSD